MKRTSYEAPHYAVFSILLPLPPFSVLKFTQHSVLSHVPSQSRHLAKETDGLTERNTYEQVRGNIIWLYDIDSLPCSEFRNRMEQSATAW